MSLALLARCEPSTREPFAGASVLGSVVAIRDQLPGEPLGVSIPLSVPAGLLAGWGLRSRRR
jgi:hypothetical protein